MKKINVVFLLKTALILAVCLSVFACNQNGVTDKQEFADVTISIGGLQAESRHIRSIGENGLPDLIDKDTKITITVAYNGTTKAENKNTLTLKNMRVGTEIDITVEVKTAYASWADGKKYTVKAGQNKIDIKLAKTAKSASNFLMSVSPNTQKTSIKLGETEIFNEKISGTPYTARDSLGRLYLMYSDEYNIVLNRFTVEGNRDADYEAAVKNVLPAGIARPELFAVEFKNENIFFIARGDIYYLEKNGSGFRSFTATPPCDAYSNILAMAAYDGKLFCIEASNSCKLKVYRYEIDSGTNALTFTALPGEAELTIAIHGITGHLQLNEGALFADDAGIYCLLNSSSGISSQQIYAVGKFFHYEYDGSNFTLKKEAGLNQGNRTKNKQKL